jgi:transglutaminase-like putative cysteine protease
MTTPRLTVAWPSARAWTDVVVLLALALLGIIGFAPSFGGASFLIAGIGGLVLGAATAIGSHLLRLSALTTALVAIVLYLVAGPAIAVPSQAIAGVLPSLSGLASVALGTVYGWADIVTLGTPVGAPVYIGVVPYAASWIVALVATLLAVRWLPRRDRAAWRLGLAALGPVALYLGAILLGTDEAFQAGVRGVVFAIILLVWLGWRTPLGGEAAGSISSLRSRKLAGTLVLVVLATVGGGAAAALFAPPPEQRFVLREEITPPFDPLDYPSPLSGFRHFTKQVTDEVMFEVEGLEPGDRLRMAVLDSFTGKLWNVAGADASVDGSGSFALVGRALPAPPVATTEARDAVTVTVVGYDDVWVPGIGYPDDFQLTGESAERSDDLRYNAGTGSMVLTSGLAAGDSYVMTSGVQVVPALDELSAVSVASVELPPVENVPDIIAASAQELSGGADDPIDQLEAIRVSFVRDGFFSRGRASDSVPSRAGHGSDRIIELLERSEMIGDEEQYASAFALMARSLGFPARVVMGFAPEIAQGAGVVEITGDDVTAWVEVAFDDVGWVPFDPTPDETDIPQDQEPEPQSEPQPQVRQPPRAESDEDELLSPVELDEQEDDEQGQPFVLPGWVMAVALSILTPLLLALIPLLVVGALKTRRARRRRSAPATHDGAAGAWDELADRYAELGFAVPARQTRPSVAANLERQLAELPTEAALPRLRTLASTTDEAVFSGRDVEGQESEEMWTTALGAVEVATAAVPRSRRMLSRYRIRSARRAHTAGHASPSRTGAP